MTADLNNLTPENIRLTQDITYIGIEMGLDGALINAAINIANVESSLRYDARALNSTAWGPFQYLDSSWNTGWSRLVRDQSDVGLTINSELTAEGTRNSFEWQIRVALNEFRIYYSGYPDTIASSWQDDVQSLVDRGYNPDSIFLEYAYLRHNTDSSVGGQVETVYARDFTVDTVEYANALGSTSYLLISTLGADQEIAISGITVCRDSGGEVLVDIQYYGGSDALRHDGLSPDQITVNPRTGRIIATYPDGTTNDFTRVGNEIFANCFLAGTQILLADGAEKSIEEIVPGDWVISYDAAGNLVPGRVSRTFQKDAKHILDFFGLMVTPGHVMLCGAGRYAGRHVTLLDILRSDGAVVRADGGLIRAATGAPVGSELDAEIEVVTGTAGPQGFVVAAAGRLRMGTDLPPGRPLFITRVLGVDNGRFQVWQARRGRSPQIAQALGALAAASGFRAMSAA